MSQTVLTEILTADAGMRVAFAKPDSFVTFANTPISLRNAARDSGEYLSVSDTEECPADVLYALLELPPLGFAYDPDEGFIWNDPPSWRDKDGDVVYDAEGTIVCEDYGLLNHSMWDYQIGATINDGTVVMLDYTTESNKPKMKRLTYRADGTLVEDGGWYLGDVTNLNLPVTSGAVITLEGGRFAYVRVDNDNPNFGYYIFDNQEDTFDFWLSRGVGNKTGYDVDGFTRLYESDDGRAWYIYPHTYGDGKWYFIALTISDVDGTFSVSRGGTAIDDQGVANPGRCKLFKDDQGRFWLFEGTSDGTVRNAWEVDIENRTVGTKHILERPSTYAWTRDAVIIGTRFIAEFDTGSGFNKDYYYTIDLATETWTIDGSCPQVSIVFSSTDKWALQDGYVLKDISAGAWSSNIKRRVSY